MATSVATRAWQVLKVQALPGHVLHVALNRPEKMNSFDARMWEELRECFHLIKNDTNYRAIVVSGEGKCFSAGIDLNSFTSLSGGGEESIDPARKSYHLRKTILDLQASFTAMEDVDQPVISAIHGACIGAGIDMITAADIRYCSKDAYFSVKEVDVGLAADVGTLQRLPKVVGNQSLVRELVFTARKFLADEALSMGLVSRVLPDKESTLEAAITLAKSIASKSPVAVAGSKRSLVYSRDHSVPEGLQHVSLWNSALLATEDIPESVSAQIQKRPAIYNKL